MRQGLGSRLRDLRSEARRLLGTLTLRDGAVVLSFYREVKGDADREQRAGLRWSRERVAHIHGH